MDEHAIRKILEGGGGGAGALLRAGLWAPGKAYGLAMRWRRAAYRQGFLHSFRSPLPVISIGNLTAGGSGKTPFTVMVARRLAQSGKRPAVLLRGYRQSADGLSDEAALYEKLCPGLIVQAGSDRVAGAARAEARGADVLLMDDGFQHLRLVRDLDIILVDATSPWGGGNTIPGGLLREPKSALRVAGAVVVTRSDQVDAATLAATLEEIRRLAPEAMLLTARHRPARLASLGGDSLPMETLRGRAVVALSGIARPEAFHRTLAELGANVASAFSGRDHDDFDGDFLARALEAAENCGAVVVTTEKDRVKKIFASMADNNPVDNVTMRVCNNNVKDRIWVLGIEQETEGEEGLLQLIENVIARPS